MEKHGNTWKNMLEDLSGTPPRFPFLTFSDCVAISVTFATFLLAQTALGLSYTSVPCPPAKVGLLNSEAHGDRDRVLLSKNLLMDCIR